MTKTLCLDFGNTRMKAAIFYNEEIKESITLHEDGIADLQNFINKHTPNHAILSSVINHAEAIEDSLMKHTKFHKLSSASKLPFTIPVGKPETMGTDRIALAAAAVHLFPKKNNLAIGLGSCITYNFINKFNQFLGGSISPGMQMRFKAMNDYTAKLPLAKPDWNVPLIGYDTATNLQSGVVLGIAKEIEGITDEYQKRYGNFNVLLTGGDIGYFEPHFKKQIFAHPDLIFKGLYAISQINNA